MKECEECSANPIICEYCIYHNGNTKENNKNTYNEKIIFYNNEQYDGKSKKVCPICKKIYTGYPATSRKDNKTLICSECGMKEIQEPFEELLGKYGFEIIRD